MSSQHTLYVSNRQYTFTENLLMQQTSNYLSKDKGKISMDRLNIL